MSIARPARYVGRYAPSPTGRIHLGVARSFLAAFLDARAHGGRIILRIEDIDTHRNVPGATEAIFRDLEWLGLEWDEGPGRPGPNQPYLQSARSDRYAAAIEKLESLGRTYPCTCSRKEIALTSSAPHGPSEEGPRYPGTCRPREAARGGGGSAGEPADTPARPSRTDRRSSIRFWTRPGDLIRHCDRRFGPCDQDVHDAIGDFVLKRADGMWAYQLAVVVDDLEQGITTVVRGADLLQSTPRQLLLRRLLAPDAPALGTLHVPLLLGPTGERLAKRDGAIAVADRRARGETAERIIGELAFSLGQLTSPRNVRASELIETWDPDKIPTMDAAYWGL